MMSRSQPRCDGSVAVMDYSGSAVPPEPSERYPCCRALSTGRKCHIVTSAEISDPVPWRMNSIRTFTPAGASRNRRTVDDRPAPPVAADDGRWFGQATGPVGARGPTSSDFRARVSCGGRSRPVKGTWLPLSATNHKLRTSGCGSRASLGQVKVHIAPGHSVGPRVAEPMRPGDPPIPSRLFHG